LKHFSFILFQVETDPLIQPQWPSDTERGLWNRGEQNMFISWLAARYERSALPDELQRWCGRIKGKHKKPMKQIK